MNYFVTGATGFIGRNLVKRLLQREGTVYALVRAGSRGRLEELRTAWGPDGARVVPIAGDLAHARSRGLRGGPADPARRGRPLLPPGRDLRHDRWLRSAGGRQRRGHPPRGRTRRRDRGRLLPPGQLDRRRRPLQGRMARGHVRRGRKTRHPSLLPHQARVRAGRARGVLAAVAGLPAGDRRRRLAHRGDRQGRRALLLLQAAAAGSTGAAELAAGGRHRRRRDQHRPGRLRRRRDRPHRPSAGPRRPDLLPHRPGAEERRRGDQPLRPRRRRAAGGAAARLRRDRSGDLAGADRPALLPAGEAGGESGAGRSSASRPACSATSTTRPASTRATRRRR